MTPDAAPLSVLLVSEPGTDGVFCHVRDLARYLIARGIRTHLAYSTTRGAPAVEALAREVRAAGGETLDLRVSNAPRAADAPALLGLRRLARTVRPDAIHAHSSKAGALARMLPLLGVRARFFYTPHAYYEMNGSAVNGRKRFFIAVERALSRVGTTVNVSASEAAYAREVIGVPPARLRTIPNGVDCERFHPAPDAGAKAAARRRFGLPEDALILGTVARYTPQKDPLTLYRAILRCLERNPSLTFAHLGRGEMFQEVSDLVATVPAPVRARIHRVEVSDDSAGFYQTLDAFTLPSRFEGFALSALEALATGLPLILTDVPGNADLKSFSFDHIRWATAGDPESVGAEVNAWVDAPPRHTNHREIVLQKLSASSSFDRILALYQGEGVLPARATDRKKAPAQPSSTVV